MSQLSYNFNLQAGVPGGLCDTAPHEIVARANGEAAPGVVKYGMGVVVGDNPGKDVKLPVTASTVEKFEGVVKTGISQMDLEGNSALRQTQTLNVLKWGNVWLRLVEGLTITYGDPVYLVNTGADAGLFTNEEGDGIAINGKFLGGVESGNIALAEIFNQIAPAAAPAGGED
jgi:hypothetical protein